MAIQAWTSDLSRPENIVMKGAQVEKELGTVYRKQSEKGKS